MNYASIYVKGGLAYGDFAPYYTHCDLCVLI